VIGPDGGGELIFEATCDGTADKVTAVDDLVEALVDLAGVRPHQLSQVKERDLGHEVAQAWNSAKSRM